MANGKRKKAADELRVRANLSAKEARESAIRKAETFYAPIERKARANYESAKKTADEMLARAYFRAYKGPTSNVASVMVKLLNADRARCRERFGE